MQRARPLGGLFLLWATVGCGLIAPPPRPDPELLGCYSLETNLPESFSDSLSYHLPQVIQLDYRSDGQWLVYPTDEEMHPTWTVLDGLPSGHVRRQLGLKKATMMEMDSILTVPGDSVDIRFPGFGGALVLRVGPHPEGLRGRAEWVIHQQISYMNDGVFALLRPTSCSDLAPRLVRTRRPWIFGGKVVLDTGQAPIEG